jgi:hypothetical protein
MLKRCSSCKVEKPLDCFSPQSNGPHGRRSACKECEAQRGRRLTVRNPISRRSAWLKHKYGIDVGEYNRLLESQHGVCALCSRSCATGRNLAVDHEHSTGEVRGLLCQACNTALGKFQDNPTLMRQAADYVEKYK